MSYNGWILIFIVNFLIFVINIVISRRTGRGKPWQI